MSSWPTVYESGIVTTAVWIDVDAMVVFAILGEEVTSPWYIQWNKVSAPTCLLCPNGWMVCLLREASGIAMIYTISVRLASSTFVKLRCV